MTIKNGNFTITPAQANSKCYLKALQEEIHIGSQIDETSL